MKRNLYILIYLIGFTTVSLWGSQCFEINVQEAITPFHIIKIPLRNIPEDVYFIEANIRITSKFTDLKHTSHYPILKNTLGETFSLLHFVWLLNTDSDDETNAKIVVDYDYGIPLPTYSYLLQVDFDPKTKLRTSKPTLQSKKQIKNQTLIKENHSKAVIFIHGIQGGRYEQILQGFSEKGNNDWRNNVLKTYWEKHYQYDDVDYFEYQFDSLFQPAEFYGERLCELIETSGLLETYEDIYLVAYSMGTIVARYAMNTPLKKHKDYLGDHINKAFLIGGVLEGTFFSNLVDFIITQMPLGTYPQIINTNEKKKMIKSFYRALNILYHLEEHAFDPDTISDFLKMFLELYQTNPLLANILFISFDDIPFIGGQLIPFEGMSSMRYTSKEFLNQLEQTLNLPVDTYIENDELSDLNQRDLFTGKLILINSYLEEAEETLQTIIKTSNYFNLQTLFSNIPTLNHNTDILSIPYVQFIGQRALSLIMTQLGNTSTEPLHGMNDGFVTLWSEQLSDHNHDVKKENIYLFKNLDHAQIKDHPQVLQLMKGLIQTD